MDKSRFQSLENRNKYDKKRNYLSWLWVLLCSVSILLTVPVGRKIQKFVYEHWGRSFFGYFVFVVFALAFIYLLFYLLIKLKIRSASNYVWLIAIAGLYTYFTLKLWKIPEEAIHFLEYGLLGFFLFKALNHSIKDKSIYITATLFALFIGTFDEIFQWIIPQRYWDFRDVGLNGFSGGLFQLAVCTVIKPKTISGRFNMKSLRRFSVIFSLCLILLGLCVSNTPQRVASYTKRISFLSFLKKEEPMSEFGYKHIDPEIGIFYSRLSLRSLKKTDENRGNEYAQILNDAVSVKYDQFIKEYNPSSNPFLHELRIHAFRRDEHFERGQNNSDINKKKEFYFTAIKENHILEKYFSLTIKNSVYLWDDNRIKILEDLTEKDNSYESPVSANLFTDFTERSTWITILTLISILVAINVIWTLKSKLENKQLNTK